jgi:hypothetical protein
LSHGREEKPTDDGKSNQQQSREERAPPRKEAHETASGNSDKDNSRMREEGKTLMRTEVPLVSAKDVEEWVTNLKIALSLWSVPDARKKGIYPELVVSLFHGNVLHLIVD